LFYQLQKFTDIFILIFGNIWRHCGISEPSVSVRVRFNDPFLHIDVANQIAPGVRTKLAEDRVDEIRAKIAAGMYHRALSSEGGTGLIKIRNIGGSEPDGSPTLEFGFEDDNLFRVYLRLHSTVLEVKPE
jgi:hypothetical protein